MASNPICRVCGKGMVRLTPSNTWFCTKCGGSAVIFGRTKDALNPDRPGLKDDVAAGGKAETQKER